MNRKELTFQCVYQLKTFFFLFFRGPNSTLRLRVISCCSGNVLVWVFFPVCFKPLFLFHSGCSHLCRPSSECVVYQCRWFAEQMLNTCHHQVSINATAAAVEFSSLMSFSVVFIHMKKPFHGGQPRLSSGWKPKQFFKSSFYLLTIQFIFLFRPTQLSIKMRGETSLRRQDSLLALYTMTEHFHRQCVINKKH